ncbi:GNAT family N-acetyltransferase [Halobacillus rhizosphaerae]|uniref:GNAT family N-acetyltransferase n=1 Tax=Halobacillus rhizosphaerae TaxID=3064889 RepID=UPI00398B8CBC
MKKDENVEIIKAGLEQLDLVTELFDKYRIFYEQPSNLSEGKKFIRERMEQGQSVIFLAIEKQESTDIPLGFVQLYPTFSSVNLAKRWILNDLYVDQLARRRGVAKGLMQKAKEYAVDTGAIELSLETAADNTNAQHLYEWLGYEKDEKHFYYHLSLD